MGARDFGVANLGLPWWREDVAALGRMEVGIRSHYPDIEKSKFRDKLVYCLTVDVPCYEARYVTVFSTHATRLLVFRYSPTDLPGLVTGTMTVVYVCGTLMIHQI
jgi:hypothetical protein